MRYLIVLLGILICGGATAAHALSADTVAQRCKALKVEKPSEADLGKASFCLGYMMGAVEIQAYLHQKGIGSQVDVCIPDSIDGKEMALVFLKYLDDYPEELQVNAAIVVHAAIARTYCKP
jgi:hypothetical protein